MSSVKDETALELGAGNSKAISLGFLASDFY